MTITTGSASDSAAIYNQLNTGSGASSAASTSQATSDRFLKLLVTQMQNQDPLSPMDNAQVTSQMAQINTVTGIDKLNTSINAMAAQFMQMQAMQGASLVGRGVQVEGNSLTLDANGKASGGFDLAGAADSVKVEVLSASGRVIDTLNLGADSAGRHSFDWTPPAGVDASGALKFKVTALSGSAAVAATTLQHDQVAAVSTSGNTLSLELGSGKTVSYADIKAFD
ncbi:MAG: flagellar hook assembly protein FlgD [Burkholderiales bacterium]|nr:flagellar hook assembly protein FlgD [Burkholderiales bacterium]